MNKNNKISNKRKSFLAILFLVAVIGAMIVTSVGASLRSVELHALELELAEIDKGNRRLEDEVIMHTSLTQVGEGALGFVRPEQVVYLDKNVAVLGYAK